MSEAEPGTRIDLNPDLPAVQIPTTVFNEICAHALETQPEECCGLIASAAEHRFDRAFRCRNDMTLRHREEPSAFPRDGREAFYMNEMDYLNVDKRVVSEGGKITAIYHSHVGAGVYFSEMDREFAEQPFFPFPDAAHIVVAVWDRMAAAGIFERDGSGHLVGRSLEACEL